MISASLRSTRKRIGSLHRDVGAHLPAFCTSMGRVLLAALPDAELEAFLAKHQFQSFTRFTITDKKGLRAAVEKTRKGRYSLLDQEVGNRSALDRAVPVQNASGRTVAAMNVSARASRTQKKYMLDVFLPVLWEAAHKMKPLLVG